MPIPNKVQSLLADVRFWANNQSEHGQILLSVLPRLRPIYTEQLASFRRRFANLESAIENIELRLMQNPEMQEQVLAQAVTVVREGQQLNRDFIALLNELLMVYPEADYSLLLHHILTESHKLAEKLRLLELALPPQNQPLPRQTPESFLQQLEFWTRDQREHGQLLRATLPGLTMNDREALLRFERKWRALEQTVRRLREALTLPGQTSELLNAEIRRLVLMTRNLALEYARFLENLLSRYNDPTSRFTIRHMLKETRKFIEELRESDYFIL
ncbi:MAG: DUF2935 domain-containing protein [bacterium]